MGDNVSSPAKTLSLGRQIASVGIPRLCNGVIEAAWLAAVVVVPCLFNPHSESGFQPNKIAFFQLLSLIIVAAWITKSVVSDRAIKSRVGEALLACRNFPFVGALGILVLAYVLSTAFSINPIASLWGSYETAQGSFTFYCGFFFFAALAGCLGHREQIDRLVTTIVLASFPLALYGIIERAGYDCLPHESHFRVFSLLGHPMYFSAYLLLVMPLTLWRILYHARELGSASGPGWAHVTGSALYGLILLTQLLAFFFAETRGALLGLLAGLFFYILSIGVHRRSRSILASAAAGAVTVLVALLILSLPNGPLKRWTSLPVAHRLSQVFSPRESAASIRLDYWAGAVKIMTSDRPIPLSAGGHDHFHWLRPLIGYGPETVNCVLSREYSCPGPNPKLENRLHNLVLDTWFSLGAAGVVALLACFILAFLQVYRAWGWVSTIKEHVLFFGLAFGLAVTTAVGLLVWRGPGLIGVGVQFGLAGGLVFYPLVAVILRSNNNHDTTRKTDFNNDTFSLAILAALLGHLVDMAFGFETAATSVLIWVYLGLIVALARSSDAVRTRLTSESTSQHPAVGTNQGRQRGTPKMRRHSQAGRTAPSAPATLLSAAIISLILVSLLFAFIQIYSTQPLTTSGVLLKSLAQLDGGRRGNPFLIPLLLLTWVGCSIAFTLDHPLNHRKKTWWRNFLLTLAVSGLIACAYAALKGLAIANLGPVPYPGASIQSVLRQGSRYVEICVVFLGFCVCFVLCAGWLSSREWQPSSMNPARTLGAGVASTTAVAVIAWFTVVRFLRADVSCHWAEALSSFDNDPMSAEVYRHMLTIDSRPLVYRGSFAQTLMSMAEKAPDDPSFDDLASEAEKALLAQSNSGVDRTSRQLALLYIEWAAQEQRPEKKLSLARKAGSALDQALLLEPKDEQAWRESAAVDILFLGREEAGKAKIRIAVDLARNQDQFAFGNYYAEQSRESRNIALKKQYGSYALEYYDNALKDAAAHGASTFSILMAKAGTSSDLGDTKQAIASYSEAATLNGETQSWQAEKALAGIYAKEGDMAEVLKHLAHAKEGSALTKQKLQ